MAKKKQTEKRAQERGVNPNVKGLHAEVVEQPITATLETNYMPYAMSVIISRAIPEIDGFKPSHRKLLYTMYKMGLLTGARTKSANIVGSTMRLNPHGDAAIYETMVRLSKGCEALLTPFVDSKGNFGKVYSRDMSYAAPRYTEAKLSAICAELFRDVDKDTVDMVDNYDGSMKEPSLLPTTFPNVLVSANTGIAVGMASQICGFNLKEVCDTTIAYLKDPSCNLMLTLPAPDFPTGGEILFDADEMNAIYKTGRGSFRVRSRWRFLKDENIIEVYEIPYTTTAEAIIEKVIELNKAGKVKEISDIRDETDLNGLKIAIDVKRGTDPDKLMTKLFRLTPLMDPFPCNFNILVAGSPKVMGVGEILEEWTAWRMECIRRRVFFDLGKKKDKLHLLNGLKKILLDIDKAIEIIRNTEHEADVVPNLMIGFGIDEIQAEFVAEIKLRNINREYILKRTEETEALEKEIADLQDILDSKRRIKKIIITELEAVSKKYGEGRKTGIIAAEDTGIDEEEEGPEDYPVTAFLTREGYFKKITPQSLRMASEHKLKENDELMTSFECMNNSVIIVFTNLQQAYKFECNEFKDSKASEWGTYLPGKLEMDEGEVPIAMVNAGKFEEHLLFCFANGKVARVPLSSYSTKTKRKKLTGAYGGTSPVASILKIGDDEGIVLYSSDNRALILSSSLIAPKATRSNQGIQVMKLKGKHTVTGACLVSQSRIKDLARYRAKALPALGALIKPEDDGEQQMSLMDE